MRREDPTRRLAEIVARAIVRRELRRRMTPRELVEASARARALGTDELAAVMLEAAR